MQKYHFLIVSLVLSYLCSVSAFANSGEVSLTGTVSTGTIVVSSSGSLPSLDSAPYIQSFPIQPIVGNIPQMTPWELLHRSRMLAGFTWTGIVAQYITPVMYTGTPFFGNNSNAIVSNNQEMMADPVDYKTCIQHESYLSFARGERIEDTDIRELKSIAKVCAQEFYGSYFDGKTYTTREEYLMMLFTLFNEDIGFEGTFTENGRYLSKGLGVDSGFSNVSATSWYSSYVALASDLGMTADEGSLWQVGKMIDDKEATEILALYVADRMDFTGESLDKGMIIENSLKYTFDFFSMNSVEIHIQ